MCTLMQDVSHPQVNELEGQQTDSHARTHAQAQAHAHAHAHAQAHAHDVTSISSVFTAPE